MKERPDVGVYVKDLSSYVMNNADDLDKTMTLGNKNRECSFTVHSILALMHTYCSFVFNPLSPWANSDQYQISLHVISMPIQPLKSRELRNN